MSVIPTAQVYRCFDEAGQLLYVGMSMSAEGRMRNHVRKPWFSRVARVTVTPLMERRAALHYEHDAIVAERPLHNAPRKPRFILPPMSEHTGAAS